MTPTTDPGDFRVNPSAAGGSAAVRAVPEQRGGAQPADEESPEHSYGRPLDDPQPSAPDRPQLDQDDRDGRDFSSVVADASSLSRRAYTEALLEGVPLPATRADLIEHARRSGGEDAVRMLKKLPNRRFSWIDEVGEELAAVQVDRSPSRTVPEAESGLPPGGHAYGLSSGSAA